MATFYGWGSTASRLEPLRGGTSFFTTKFPEIPGTHFIDLGRMNDWVLNTGPLDSESRALTTRPPLLLKLQNNAVFVNLLLSFWCHLVFYIYHLNYFTKT